MMKNGDYYSRLIAGTMTWGSWGKGYSTREMQELMHHCLNLGITSFDHADIYGGYTNEADFGKALHSSGIDRESIQLISKCGIQYTGEARDNRVKHYQYDRDYILWSAETSLKNLKTEYLDLFLLHRPSPLMQPDEIAEAMVRLKKDGKVRDFGVSNFTPSQIALIESAIPVSANQVEFSLTARDVMFDGTLDDCIINKRQAMAWSPLGSYLRTEDKAQKRIRKVMKDLCLRYEASESQILISWVLKHPARILPVFGSTNSERIEEMTGALNIDLSTEDWFVLLIAAQGHKVP